MNADEICAGCCDSHCRHADWCIGIRFDSRKAPRGVYEAAPELYTALEHCARVLRLQRTNTAVADAALAKARQCDDFAFSGRLAPWQCAHCGAHRRRHSK